MPLIRTEVQLIKCDMSLLDWQKKHLLTYSVGKSVEKQAIMWLEGMLMDAVSLAMSLKIKAHTVFDLPIQFVGIYLTEFTNRNEDVRTEVFILAILQLKCGTI